MYLLLRFFCATVSAGIVMIFTSIVTHLFYRLSPYWNCYGEYCYEQLIWYRELGFNLSVVSGVLWMAAWVFLEIRTRRRFSRPIPKLVTHLRYGPIFILVFSIAAILATDLFLIQYSRWQIVRYIHSNAPVTEAPSLKLHNNYRGWWGNGFSANEYHLYGDTAAAYIDDPDPATRARALQASMYVYDWLNQPNDGPSITAFKKAMADSDPMVRGVAAKFSAELFYDEAP